MEFHYEHLGPLLEVTMNEALSNMEVGEFLSELENQTDSIRIRGNRLLTDEFLKKFEGFDDVQRGGGKFCHYLNYFQTRSVSIFLCLG